MKPRRETVLALVLFALLSPAILASHAWSLAPEDAWLFSAFAALGLAVAFIVPGARLFSRPWLRLGWVLLWAEALALFQAGRLLSYYFQGESFNERFFFHFNLNALVEAGPAYWPLVLAVTALLLAVALAALLLHPRERALPRAAWLCVLALPAFGALDPGARALLAGGWARLERPPIAVPADIPWAALGLDPAALQAAPGDFPAAGRSGARRNLVLVYLEGLERVYTEPGIFPGLTPNLNRLAAAGLRFSELVSTEGTTWTVGGLLASQCGTPLVHDLGAGSNDILQNGFLNRAVCLGDVLATAGYRQVFMGGASTSFAGKGDFLASHGYDEVLGREELAPLLEDPAYLSGWGLYDDSLFALAADRFAELAARGAPFNLTLLTLDTHHPEGHPSASCPRYEAIDNSILHAVHCTDFLLGRFIDELSAHPAWRDTVVVLMSDHLAMRNVAQRFYPPGYDRKLFLSVLNAGAGTVAARGSHMDLAPTVLELLGVNAGVPFLAGSSLLGEDRPGAAVDLGAPARLRALRYINTSLLTGSLAGLCEARPIIAAAGTGLRLGGWDTVLSVAGSQIQLAALESSHALLAVLGPEGRISSLTAVFLANLPHVLYQQRDASILLIGPGDRLPAAAGASGPASGVVALLGNPRGSWISLGSAPRASELRVEGEDCAALLEAVEVGGASDAELLGAICPAGSAAGILEEGALKLPRVVIENGWYEALLDGSAAEGFALRERRLLGSVADAGLPGRCHAYFGGGRLVVPRVEGAEGVEALTMRMVPGSVGLFETVRVFPR